MDESTAGRLIADKYRVMRALGHGSTGTVFLCEHTALEKQVAVKVLHRELADNTGLVQRFQREARTAARLDHPNTVHVMDFGQDDDGTLYLVMEYVDGRDLAEVLESEWPLSDQRIMGIMSQVLSALSAAHALGIVHRDLKPENILVRSATEAQDEQIKVCDFGIAQLSPIRLARAGKPHSAMPLRVTGDGMVVGTPAYMSPEQARALPLDARSDLYSAGVVLFQLLTRTLPFVSETPMSVAVMHCTTPPPVPSGFGPVNPALEAVCLKAMCKTPDARYQTAAEMLAALTKAKGHPSSARMLARRSLTPVTGSDEARVALARRSSTAIERTSRTPRLGAPVAGISGAPTELCVPAVHGRIQPGARRKRRTGSLLLAAVAISLLGLVAVPRLLPSEKDAASAREEREERPEAPAVDQVAAAAQPAAPLASEPTAPPAPAREPAATAPAAPEPRAVSVLASAAPASSTRHGAVRLRKPAAASPEAPATATDAPTNALPNEVHDIARSVLAESANREAAAPLITAKAIDLKPAEETMSGASPEASAVAPEPAHKAPEPPPVAVAAPGPQPLAASNVEQAKVAIGSTHSRGVAKANVRAALNQAAFTRCYRDARRSGVGPSAAASASLELNTDMSGRITSARLGGALPKSLRECVEQAARVGQVRGVDTGEAQATIELQFQP